MSTDRAPTPGSQPALSDGGDHTPEPGPAPDQRYTREGLLGTGGMGRVYAVRDQLLQRQVALKVAASPALAARLTREAAITAQLEHPGIVAVYDTGVQDGQVWYTMRLLRGRTLGERLGACPDAATRLTLVPRLLAACQAVAYAHARGIVHRDLKPANLMLGEFGETQVADWGLAAPVAEARGGGPVGTTGYMAPELRRGEGASPPSDVYALGVVLHELLSGRAPPDGGPDAASLEGNAPPELVAIVRRALSADPAARYPDAGALAEELERWLSGRRVLAHAYRPSELLLRVVRAWRVPLGVGAVALAVLAVAVADGFRRVSDERVVAEANLAVALTEQALRAQADGRLPEAQVLAAHALDLAPSAEARGVLAAIPTPTASRTSRVPLPEACRHTAVPSPDGATLACRSEGRLERWSVEPLVLEFGAALVAVGDPVWLGDMLVVATADGLARVTPDGVVHPGDEGAGWVPQGGGARGYAQRGRDARTLSEEGVGPAFPLCAAARTATRVSGDELLVGCDDGVLRAYGPDGAERWQVPLGAPPTWTALARVGAHLYTGHLDGHVAVVSLADGTAGAPLAGGVTGIRSLVPVPGLEAGVLVLGERGGPRLWDTSADEWAGALPGGATRIAPGAAPGEVLLVGEALERWRFTSLPTPGVLTFGSGISQVTLSPDGSSVAAALGAGDVVERRRSDGRRLRTWRWADGVAKCVAYGGEGRLLGGAMGGAPRRLGPDLEQVPLDATVLRRAGSLADGRVWGVSYSDVVVLADLASDTVVTTRAGPGLVDGSSSPSGDTAALVDSRGGVWVLVGERWEERRRAPDVGAVDVGDGGAPLVLSRGRDVCVDDACWAVDGDVLDVALHGRLVAAATLGGEVLVHDLDGTLLARLRGHTGRVSSVEFTPDGTTLVSGGWDGTARVWDLGALRRLPVALLRDAEAAWGLGLDEAMRGR